MSDYYHTNHLLFRRFKILEKHHKEIAAEIPPFDQTKVSFKRELGDWYNSQNKIEKYDKIEKYISSNLEWIAGWDPDNKWFNFPLILKDEPIGCAKDICPTTIKLLQGIGGINVAGFALLVPHSRLPLHTDETGPTYGTIAFNMLLSGEKSYLIVGNSPPYTHTIGKAVLFNSELKHYARNDSDDVRTILYIDTVLQKPTT
jgi:hypothetical protein